MILCSALLLFPVPGYADWTPLIERLIADRFDEQEIRMLFKNPGVRFDPEVMSSKLTALINNRYRKPGDIVTRKRKRMYDRFLQPGVIEEAYAYAERNRDVLQRIAKDYCVPKEIVVSIVLVETELGRVLGKREAFNSLASMALCSDLEVIRPYLSPGLITSENETFARRRCRQKADWAYDELKALIRYASERAMDPLGIPGSIYGAIGICQFMPSKISTYGVDADQDGHIDVFSEHDALYSVASYLRAHGWKCRMSRKRQYRVIMAYNPSHIYANTILSVAERLKRKG
jgi:membrane-bound lytic murein transglycosylase B